ncbi:MAG: sialate O-acetylesterase [Verrucomicrobiales bacterium]
MTKSIVATWILAAGSSLAALEMPDFFANGMVLQQETGAPVWGWTDPGAAVTVSFAGQELSTKADDKGAWKVNFKGLKASEQAQVMTVKAGDESKEIGNVLVGEVWLASGQSNMEWIVQNTNDKDEANKLEDDALRVYVSKNIAIAEPQQNFPGAWKATKPGQTLYFTAVGFQFARQLRAELGVPVGIIECAWGGKSVQSFTSGEALETLPIGKQLMEQRNKAIAEFDPSEFEAKIQAMKENHAKQVAEWKKTKKGNKPRGPRYPSRPATSPNLASNNFNGMIAPLVGYGIRGALWYQGESNANGYTAPHYAELQATMVKDWRQRWGHDFSFYYVQLANYRKPTDKPGVPSNWAEVQDEQREMLDLLDGVGMAVINDIGEANDIHPRNKKDVGQRLARWALHHDYGKKDIVVSGPLYDSVEFARGQAVVRFKHAKGLKTRDGQPLKRVEIAGQDGQWHWAEAKIEGETLVASSEAVKEPVKVRYAWADNPEGATLVNGEGLPASCFSSESAGQ